MKAAITKAVEGLLKEFDRTMDCYGLNKISIDDDETVRLLIKDTRYWMKGFNGNPDQLVSIIDNLEKLKACICSGEHGNIFRYPDLIKAPIYIFADLDNMVTAADQILGAIIDE